MWDRLHLPCACLFTVVNTCNELKLKHTDGFPMSSIGVHWMNQYTYYGLIRDKSYSLIYEKMEELAVNDSKGLYCSGDILIDSLDAFDKEIE